jgi:nucleoside-triphosphatase THEP1
MTSRKLPNILIVGTPGTGKSTTAQLVQQSVPSMRHIEVGALVKDKQLHDGWDDEYECYILDEDRVRSLCSSGRLALPLLAPQWAFWHSTARLRQGRAVRRVLRAADRCCPPSLRFAMSWRTVWRVAG